MVYYPLHHLWYDLYHLQFWKERMVFRAELQIPLNGRLLWKYADGIRYQNLKNRIKPFLFEVWRKNIYSASFQKIYSTGSCFVSTNATWLSINHCQWWFAMLINNFLAVCISKMPVYWNIIPVCWIFLGWNLIAIYFAQK